MTKAATSIAQIVTKAPDLELMPPPAKVNSPPVIASIVTPPHNQTSEAAPEDEDNAMQNLLDDTRFLTQFDNEFNDLTETRTKKGKAEKKKNSDYLCYNCEAGFSSLKDLRQHKISCSTIKSTKQSNHAIKKQTAKKSKKVVVPCVSAPMVVTQSQVPMGQQTGLVTLPGGQQVRQQINAQPVLVNAAVSSAGGHYIRVSAPGIQTRPPLAGVRNVVSKRVVAVPRVSAPIVPSQQAIILRSGQQTGIVALPEGQQVRQKVNTPPVIVNATVSSAGGHHIRQSAPGIQTRPLLAGGPIVPINHLGSRFLVPLHALKKGSRFSAPLHALKNMQTGKFFCQFFGCFLLKFYF